MAHPEQQRFFKDIGQRFPEYFQANQQVLEVGSQNINGTVRDFFPENTTYLGIDIGPGKDVDLVIPGELIQLPPAWADVAISTECFEHASTWPQILENMIRITKPSGLVLLTFAGFGRPTHGTLDSDLSLSPFTGTYYKNLIPDDIYEAIRIGEYFSSHAFEVNSEAHDTYFWGIRNSREFEGQPSSLRELEAQLVQTQGQLGQSAKKISDLTYNLAEGDAKIAELRGWIGQQDSEIGELRGAVAQRDGHIDELQAAVAQGMAQIEALNGAIAQRDAQLTDLQAAVAQRDAQMIDLQAAVAQGEAQRATLTLDRQSREAQNASLSDEVQRRDRQLASLSQQLEEIETHAANLAAGLSQQQAAMASMQRSTSWRLTAPMRRLSRRAPRLTRAGRRTIKLMWLTVTLQMPGQVRQRLRMGRQVKQQAQVLGSSGLFDRAWYLTQYPDVAAAGVDPATHYLSQGALEGRDPNPLFDSDWYLSKYPDVAAAGVNPLAHYFQPGASEGRDPNPLFDSDWYLAQYPDVAMAEVNPLAHYLHNGALEGRDPNPLFDSDWYLAQYPDVATAKINPLGHYLASGALEGRNPNPSFDSAWYLTQYPDVAAAGDNPLAHYLKHGQGEARQPRPAEPKPRTFYGGVLDPEFYRTSYLSADSSSDDEVTHYVNHGLLTGTAPNRWVAQRRLERLPHKPLISILMPVYNTPRRFLAAAVDSISQQLYGHWELWIQDDGSTHPETLAYLSALASQDERIHVARFEQNQGISAATNAALGQAQGDFIALMDHDDRLTPDCLAEIVAAYNRHPRADVFYTDQAGIDEHDRFTKHHYKPDWSPWMFRGVMFVGHLLVVRRELALRVGGFDSTFDFVQDFEFMLRVSEHADSIVHVPKVLYHWREIPASVAGGGKSEIDFGQLQTAAVNAHLARLNLPVTAKKHPTHPHRAILEPAASVPLAPVRVLIMGETTGEGEAEIGRLAALTDPGDVRWSYLTATDLEDPSRLRNLMQECDRDIWIFIDSRCQPAQASWVADLTRYLTLPGVGTVGPVLVSPGGTVAAAGMLLNDEGATPAMAGFDLASDGYAGSLSCLREVSALAPDCLALRKEALNLAGGLCPEYGLRYNLLDLGLRCRGAGLANLVVPWVQVHWLAQPRPIQLGIDLGERFWRSYRYADLKAGDAFYNPNLDPRRGDYTVAP
ncbi:MAG: glycosyltransferase [Nodosilinea sp.]